LKIISKEEISVLVIEDNPGDARLIEEMLKDVSKLAFEVETSDLLIKALKIFESYKFDAILLDLNLPDSIGLETVSKTLEVIRDTPIIVLTGLNEEKIAISSVKRGIQDYLVKEQLNSMLLVRSIQYAIERKKTEQKLKESEEKYKNLFKQAPMAIALINFDGIIEDCNTPAEVLFGYTKEELLGNEYLKFGNVPLDSKLFLVKSFSKFLKTGVPEHSKIQMYRKDGKMIWIETYPIIVKISEISYILVVIQDVTEKKEIEEIKTNLLTRFSHEFKTPLISIKGFTDFLLTEHNKNLDDKTISFLKKIKDGGNRLKELINSFIESSQLDQALTKLKLHQENISELIKTCLEEMQGLINLRAHTINLDIHDQLIANVDKEKMYSVITNLLLNAINYTPKGGKIWIQSIINEGSILVSVKDNGIGLEDGEKKQLFKQFGKIERYGKGWDIISEGMGMGLYLSKEIMNLHGGKMWVESKGRNKGTTFYFSLPIVRD